MLDQAILLAKGERYMHVAIIYDSKTGTTASAAQKMGKMIAQLGHHYDIYSVVQADPATVSKADLICLGSWVKGLYFIAQRPTKASMQFIEQLGDLTGKKAIVFCTYKLAAGSTLEQMARALESKGAQVVGQFKYRNAEPNHQFTSFARSLVQAA